MKQISDFSNRLKEYMVMHNNMTYDELSKLTGENAQTLNRYALGQRIPKIDSAINIALKLGISPLWLQGFDESMYSFSSKPVNINNAVASDDQALLSDFHKLNNAGRQMALAAIKGFACLPEYTEDESEEVG